MNRISKERGQNVHRKMQRSIYDSLGMSIRTFIDLFLKVVFCLEVFLESSI